MTIGNADIPLAHPAEAVLTNAVYILAALGLAIAFGGVALPVSLALIMQAIGSTLFHGTSDGARWAQLLDAVGIQWVMTALLALGVAQVGGWPPVATYAALLVLWPLVWAYIHRVPRIPLIAVESVVLLILVGITGGGGGAVFLGVLTGVAVALQRLRPTHSLGHSMWHLLSAGAQTLAVVLLIG
jgi:hypothetical protein